DTPPVRRAPVDAATVPHTLSLHDALPISQIPVCHEATATFHEVGGTQLPLGSGSLSSFLHSMGMGETNQGHVLLLSSVILEPVRSEEHTSELQSRENLV